MNIEVSRIAHRVRPALRAVALVLASLISVTIASAASGPPSVGIITTFAGVGTAGVAGDGGAATAAQVNHPLGVAVDASGNVYIADTNNHRIRKVAAGTGVISTVAGTGIAGFLGDGGAATAARLNGPYGVAVDGAGNVYIADTSNHRIRKLTVETGTITTIAGSGTAGFGGDGAVATAAFLYYPSAVAVDSSDNVYIADWYNHRIRKVASGTNLISTVAGTGTAGYNGDGLATGAQLHDPLGVAVDAAANVYIADQSNSRVRKVTAATGVISTVAGTGTFGTAGEAVLATTAQLSYPRGIALDSTGNLFICDFYYDRVRKVTLATGVITTVAGSFTTAFGGDGGAAPAAQLNDPFGVAVDAAGNLYIADNNNNRIRMVSAPTTPSLLMTTVAGTGTPGYNGDGAGTGAQLNNPLGVAVDGAGNIYIADQGNSRIRKVIASTGVITTVAGTGIAGFTGDTGPATAARLYYPRGVAVDLAGNVYIADHYNERIRKVSASTGVITTIAGNGAAGFGGDGVIATATQLNNPYGIAVDAAGNVFIADQSNNRIRKVTAATGLITTVAGNGTPGVSGDGGAATAAQLNQPIGVAVDAAGNIYIADNSNNRIRKVTAATGLISTVVGTGTAGYLGENGLATAARINDPYGIAVDGAGDVYISDTGNHRLRKLTVSTGVLTTVAGSGIGMFGGDGGAAPAAMVYYPGAVAVDPTGTLYVADWYNQRVRLASVALEPPTSLVASPSGTAAVSLSWTAPAGATSFVVKRGTASGGETTLVSGITLPTYIDATPARGTKYFYVVYAVFGSNPGPNSNEVSFVVSGAVDLNGDSNGDVFIYDPAAGTWGFENTLGGGGFSTQAGAWAPGWSVASATFNTDALTDVFLFNETSGQWFKMLNDGAGGWTVDAFAAWGTSWQRFVVDLNGDGISDLFLWDPALGQWFECLSTPGGFTYLQGYWSTGWEVYPTRFNDDGLQDFFIFNRSSGQWFRVAGAAGGGFTYPQFAAWAPVWQFYPGDYNGDGLSDLFLHNPANGQWFMATNTGTDFAYVFGTFTTGWAFYPMDLDGDGRTDLFLHNPTNGQWFEMLSTGAGNFTVGGSGSFSLGWSLYPTDFNNDRRGDLLLYNPTNGQWSQARNLTLGSFSFSIGTWSANLTIVTSPPK